MNDAKYDHAVTSVDATCSSPYSQRSMRPLTYHGMDLLSLPTAAATRLGTERLLEVRGTRARITTDAVRSMREGRTTQFECLAHREAAR